MKKNTINKPFSYSSFISKLVVFSMCSTSGFFYSPQVLAQKYRTCAELQKRLNDKNNPESIFRDFEKSEIQFERAKLPTIYLLYATSFFCDGGTHTKMYKDGVRRTCNGHIQYYTSPYPNGQGLFELYSSGPAKYYDRWYLSDSDRFKRYCRQVS